MVVDTFDFNILKERPFNMAIIGKTGSGKTTFLKNLLLKLGKGYFNTIYLITNSEVGYSANNYKDYIYPNHVLYLNQDSQNIKIRIQSWLNKIKKFSYDVKDIFANNLVIYDDIGKETKDRLENFTNECRHANISNIFLVHRLEHLDTTTRDSIFFHVVNSAEELDYIKLNKNTRIEITSEIKNTYNEYKERGLYIVIYDSKIYSIIIDDSDLENIKSENKYICFTESSIKKYIFDEDETEK